LYIVEGVFDGLDASFVEDLKLPPLYLPSRIPD
jgi:hypothetical protein